MKFEECIEIVLEHEGGFTDNPKDPGQATKFGISKRAYPKLDIDKLTRNQAITIYKNDYWDKNKISDLEIENCKLMYFDCAVNQGPKRAKSLYDLARSLNKKENVLGAFARLRLQAYQSLPTFQTFGKGWSNRLLDVTIKSYEAEL